LWVNKQRQRTKKLGWGKSRRHRVGMGDFKSGRSPTKLHTSYREKNTDYTNTAEKEKKKHLVASICPKSLGLGEWRSSARVGVEVPEKRVFWKKRRRVGLTAILRSVGTGNAGVR